LKRYFIRLSYNGKAYHGWQIQPNALSVQEVLNDCISKLLKQQIQVVGCGRTDTGVHARDFYAHFDLEGLIEDEEAFTHKLNAFLPSDIAIRETFSVRKDLHARFDAQSRTYRYYITNRKNPFRIYDSWFVYGELDVEQMNKAAELLYKYEDFACFSKSNTDVKTTICDIKKALWYKEEDVLVFEITADRFLRNMVRAIVGTMVDVGKGKMSSAVFEEIIKSKDRKKAGYSVPAHGLFLENIVYDFD